MNRIIIFSCIALLTTIQICYSEYNTSHLKIDVWDPPFNNNLERKTELYTFLEQSKKKWRVYVCIPHLKDAYWMAVNYALVKSAKQLGVSLELYEAGGYGNLDAQCKQIQNCLDNNSMDALILSAVQADGFDELIETCKTKGIPVIDLINGINSDAISARVAASFWDTGFQAGSYLKNLEMTNESQVSVAWFPGPNGAGWVSDGNKGFQEALKNSNINIVATKYGDTGKSAQASLINEVLDKFEQLDYIVGTTVSAEAAVEILRKRNLSNKVKVLSYYYGPGVHRGIRRGSIVAAPTDMQAIQARIALDIAVRILENKEYVKHCSPQVITIDHDALVNFDESTSIAPMGFRPTFSVNN